MERIKIKVNIGIECDGYKCSDNCPLYDIAGYQDVNVTTIIEGENHSFTSCAVVLIWAEFYGLY
jgi:hypothetical protein